MLCRQSERLTRYKARLQRLKEHHNRCLLQHTAYLESQTQPSGREVPLLQSTELCTASQSCKNLETSLDSKSDGDSCAPQSSYSTEDPDVPPLRRTDSVFETSLDSKSDGDSCAPQSSYSTEDPDVPPLRRTDSVFLTKEYLEQFCKVTKESEVSMSSIENDDDDEYTPSRESVTESSSEESCGQARKVPLVRNKQNKSQRTCRKKTCPSTSDKINMNAESEDCNTNLSNVSVMNTIKRSGARVYSKTHYCLYCPLHCHKMARHLIRKHSNESAVAKALSFPLKSKERKLHFDLVRNQGNRAHNNEVMKTGTGTLIPSQQATKPVKASDYMHCINCQALLKRKTLWRHMSRCKLAQKCVSQKPGKSRIQALCAYAQPVPDGVSKNIWQLVNAMHQDEITNIIKKEKTILRLGEHLYLKHGHDKTKHEYIRQKLREIGRLIQQSQKAGRLKTIKDFFLPSNFNFVIDAVKAVSGFNEEKNIYKTPSLALKLGHTLKKIADILECDAQMEESDNEEFLKNLSRTRGLFEKKWDVCVSSRALQTLKEAKWNTPQLLPFTEDVKSMHIYLDKCREEYQKNLKNIPNKKYWSNLANVTLCEVILFNRRREGEVSKMPLSAYTLRNSSGIHSDLAVGLTEFEQKLCQRFQRIEIRGKRDRKVPILLTTDMLSSMEVLVSYRRACGVPDENPYFFARPEAETHLRGSDAIRRIAGECGAKHPETLSSTKLRKQVSTLSTVLNLKDNEMDILANFLGHDIRVHRQYYRLPEGTLQLAKVSKVLLALEQGRLSDFQGMSLDQIQIDPNEELPEAVDSDDPEAETERNSSLCSSECSLSIRRQATTEVSGDESTTAGSTAKRWQTDQSDSDAPLTGPSSFNRRKRPVESDSDDPKTEFSRAKKRQRTEEPDPDVSKKELSKRRGWTLGEVRAVEKTLKCFIKSGKVPGKSECVACIEASPEALKTRNWKAVKFYIKNRIAAIQRESSKRTY
ncbi:uncharacterized protein Hap1MRO34_010195 isoform 2-T2 [Clarias gariepinus]